MEDKEILQQLQALKTKLRRIEKAIEADEKKQVLKAKKEKV